MTIQTRHPSPNSSLTVGFDTADVNPVNNMLAEHMRNSSIHMCLTGGAWTLCAIVHGIRLECQDHDLVSNTVVVIASTFDFTQIVLVN